MIRYAHLDDRENIIRLVKKTFEELGLPFHQSLVEDDLDKIFGGQRQGSLWVMDCGEHTVGCIGLVGSEDQMCRIIRFYIAREYRGRGLGERLYDQAEAEARRKGFGAIQIEVSRRSTSAIDFYLRRGFDLVEKTNNRWEDNIYRKKLT